LLLPSPGASDPAIPTWNGNEFLLPDGQRPTIRTFTPIRDEAATSELTLDIVLHGAGAASAWATFATAGDHAAISGPGRGYVADPGASSFLLVGDETAIPAISQLVEALPAERPVQAGIEVRHPEAIRRLPARPATQVEWCLLSTGAAPGSAQFDYVQAADLEPGVRIWAAGEAAAILGAHDLIDETDVVGIEVAGRFGEEEHRDAATSPSISNQMLNYGSIRIPVVDSFGSVPHNFAAALPDTALSTRCESNLQGDGDLLLTRFDRRIEPPRFRNCEVAVYGDGCHVRERFGDHHRFPERDPCQSRELFGLGNGIVPRRGPSGRDEFRVVLD
jgi:NADPH-dependent ferric siderophore reductase